MPTGQRLSVANLTNIRGEIEAGKSNKEAMVTTGFSETAIQRVRTAIANNEFERMVSARANGNAARNGHKRPALAAATRRPTLEQRAKSAKVVVRVKKAHATDATTRDDRVGNPKREARVLKYHAKGWTMRQIGAKLGVHAGTVGYYIYKQRGPRKSGSETKGKEQSNGNGSNAFGRELKIGIAYSEIERFVAVLGERLGVSPEVLRRRLSELLGHSPIR